MDLSDWRARIDAVDRKLVDLINTRLQYAMEIGEIKREHNQQVRDPEREKELIGSLTEYNQGPLSDAGVADVFNRIIEEARRLEGPASDGT